MQITRTDDPVKMSREETIEAEIDDILSSIKSTEEISEKLKYHQIIHPLKILL